MLQLFKVSLACFWCVKVGVLRQSDMWTMHISGCVLPNPNTPTARTPELDIIMPVPMSNGNMIKGKSRTIREYVISKRLRRRVEELDADAVCNDDHADFDERFSWEKDLTKFEPETEEHDIGVENSRVWLQGLALREETRALLLIADMGASACDMYRREVPKMRNMRPGMDTMILERIRKGQSLHNMVFEDLLAPLRVQELPPGTEESYGDMTKVLLAWNERVAKHEEESVRKRQDFIAALEERTKTIDKVLAIVGDETNIDRFDRIGQKGILEPSQRGLLKAIHAYRPETREFRNQNPFHVLVLMWAHLQNPSLATEDDWMYLSYKVLNGEEELEIRFEREEQRRRFQEKKEEAMKEGDREELTYCTKRWNAYNRKIAETARQNIVFKIHCAHNRLKRIELDGLLDLSILQSAQQCAARNALPKGWTPPWMQILERCATADGKLDDKLERCFPALEATSEVTATQVREMTTIQDVVLTHTLKFTGADVAEMDNATKERLIEARWTDPVTVHRMEQTLYGVSETQAVATQMLRHSSVMEKSLSELLEAAKAKCEELEKLRFVADCDERPGLSGDVEEVVGMEEAEAEAEFV